MKFSCYKGDLNEALRFVMKAVAVKPITPTLAGIYLKADGSTLELQANKLSSGIVTTLPCSTEVPGEIVVIGKQLYDYARVLHDNLITFQDENSDNILAIESGGARIELLKMPASDFAKVKTDDLENLFLIQSVVLRELIRKTVFAVAKEEDARPIFTGCYFEIKDNQLSLVATNAHRLAFAKTELSDKYKDGAFVVPAESLRGLIDRIDPGKTDSSMRVTYSDRNMMVNFENVIMTTRLIDGAFPPYDKVIPTSSTTRVKVDTSELKRAVELVSLAAKQNEYNTAKFIFSQTGIEISSNASEGGGAGQNIVAEVEGDDLEISFNVNYIADVLRVIDSPYLNIALNDRYSPAAFTELNDDKYLYIVTPVRA